MIITILFFCSNTFTNTHNKFVSGHRKVLLLLRGQLPERIGNLESRPWPGRAHLLEPLPNFVGKSMLHPGQQFPCLKTNKIRSRSPLKPLSQMDFSLQKGIQVSLLFYCLERYSSEEGNGRCESVNEKTK